LKYYCVLTRCVNYWPDLIWHDSKINESNMSLIFFLPEPSQIEYWGRRLWGTQCWGKQSRGRNRYSRMRKWNKWWKRNYCEKNHKNIATIYMLRDYITYKVNNVLYEIQNSISYKKNCSQHMTFITLISKEQKPNNYFEVTKNTK
jgi:hypothetical protein